MGENGQDNRRLVGGGGYKYIKVIRRLVHFIGPIETHGLIKAKNLLRHFIYSDGLQKLSLLHQSRIATAT